MADNRAALERGFAKANVIIRERITKGLMYEAEKLAMKAYETYRSPKMGFTGQTWTGTAVGVYIERRLSYYVSTKTIADMPEAVRSKLRTGKSYFLHKPYGYVMGYTGGDRKFTPTIDTDGGSSEQDAIKFLQEHKPASKYAIVVVNGSEYANYIENVMGGDVITGTYHYANKLRAVELVKSV